MWPWEHLLFAYLLYSFYTNVVRRRSPSGPETLAVAVGSQLPDLVDKPLAWTFGVTQTGYSVVHSIFVVPFVCLAVYVLLHRWERGSIRQATAFSIAILSHLGGDIVYPWLTGGHLNPRAVTWPVTSPPTVDQGSFLDHVVIYGNRSLELFLSGDIPQELTVLLGLLVLTVVLWVYDGAPVAADCWRWVSRRT
ncbi:metal-dependent hydrolase [Saliphagus sp. GCM10025334]